MYINGDFDLEGEVIQIEIMPTHKLLSCSRKPVIASWGVAVFPSTHLHSARDIYKY